MGGDRTLEAVIFDVDGTLVESERDGHRVAFNQAFEELSLPYRWGEDEYRDLLAVTGGRRRLTGFLVDAGYAEPEAAELAARLHAIKTARFTAAAGSGAIPLRPGVGELVQGLHRDGVRLFVATTGSRAWVLPLLAHHFPHHPFELVVTGDDVPRLKPDPAAYLAVLEQAALPRDRTVAVEDSLPGLEAARAAELTCLGVRNEYNPQPLDTADLTVTGFGPGAQRISGVDAPLPQGRVSTETLDALLRQG